MCLVCPLAKAQQLPFVAIVSKLVKKIALVYADQWTSPIVLVTTTMYCLLLVDDFSKYMWVYFLSSKNQTQLSMDIFKVMFERKFECSIKVVQIDGRGEFYFINSQW